MKFISAAVLMFALLLGGFVSAVHAGDVADQIRHNTMQEHACAQSASSKSANQTDAGKAFCEAACHAVSMGSMFVAPASAEILPVVTHRIPVSHETIVGFSGSSPDRPPRLS